jgi:MFS family permease
MRSLFILSLSALAFALAQTMLIPALTDLARSLHTDASGVAWTITGYLLSAAVCTPIFGRLGDMFGKRRLLVVALGLFAAGSVVSALGTGLEVVVIGRVLQGAGGGIFPLCFGIIRDEFPRERVASSIGLISATFGIGGGAGLILGGLITDHASYHWIFWLGAITAVVAAIMTEASTCAGRSCSPSGSQRRCSRSRAPTSGAGSTTARSACSASASSSSRAG